MLKIKHIKDSFQIGILILFIILIIIFVFIPMILNNGECSTTINYDHQITKKTKVSRFDIWMDGLTIYGRVKNRMTGDLETVVLYKFIPVKGCDNIVFFQEDMKYSNKSMLYSSMSANIKSFHIGNTEVTDVFYSFIDILKQENKILTLDNYVGYNTPKKNLTYEECQLFCEDLSRILHRKFRLPTYEEWLYAAQGGEYSRGYIYSGSNNIDDVAWYNESFDSAFREPFWWCASKKPNELGLYDMSGGIEEWTSSFYSDITNEFGKGGSIALIAQQHGSLKNAHIPMGGDFSSNKEECRLDRIPLKIISRAGMRLILEP